jgi:hypothetical protein
VAERELQTVAHRTELVWTGPEVSSAGSRDTSVVVRELLSGAEQSVLIATFQGAQVFRTLADRMAAIRMFPGRGPFSTPSASSSTTAAPSSRRRTSPRLPRNETSRPACS